MANVKKSMQICAQIHDGIIGRDLQFAGPFGERQVLYCDYTASGKALEFIEDFLRQQVLPYYANTHSTISATSQQTTQFLKEAREIIRSAVNANENDAVIFVGSGCTAAVNLLIHALHLKHPPIVFVSPWEHHSNLLPWREIGAEVLQTEMTDDGRIDLDNFKQLIQVKLFAHKQETELKSSEAPGIQIIGAFCTCSNVTGQLLEIEEITKILHEYGGLSFWDYAACAPYVEVNMNPLSQDCWKDAIYFSGHKFVGGPQTPGVLVAKHKLFKSTTPLRIGGGTVFFVRREKHRYLKSPEHREEGGTPDIIGAIRLGLVLKLKTAIGVDYIMQREKEIVKYVWDQWSQFRQILVVLGNPTLPKLPIFSFLIRNEATGLYLHHNFVCALLNDLFGIQTRAGCMCAGPYVEELLGIDEDMAAAFEAILQKTSNTEEEKFAKESSEFEMLRPGIVRLNFPYFMQQHEIEYVCKAVIMVAENGWKLLPQYRLNMDTGEWSHCKSSKGCHRTLQGFNTHLSRSCTNRSILGSHSMQNGLGNQSEIDWTIYLENAKAIFKDAETQLASNNVEDQRYHFEVHQLAHLRWFLLAIEAQDLLENRSIQNLIPCKAAYSARNFQKIQHNIPLWERIEPNYTKNVHRLRAKFETKEAESELKLKETTTEMQIFQSKSSKEFKWTEQKTTEILAHHFFGVGQEISVRAAR